MRELSAEARLHLYARSLSGRTERRIHTAALYGAFGLIAAVVIWHAVGSPVLKSWICGAVNARTLCPSREFRLTSL